MNTQALISVAGLLGWPVAHKDDQQVGRLVDFVFRWDTQQKYPPLAGIIVAVGRRKVWIAESDIAKVARDEIRLKTARLDLRDFKARPGEVRIVSEVLDHQLVDVDGARVVRASDLYVSQLGGTIHLVGVDVGFVALMRRLGPAFWRRRPPQKGSVIDWSAVHSFGADTGSTAGVQIASSRNELKRLRPGELADVLEDLGRDERQALLESLDPADAADALEEMEPSELEGILRETDPEDAAQYLANMEPDEAADALRDVDQELRDELLARMPDESIEQIEGVLSHDEDTAGGFMTTALVTSGPIETVRALRARLAKGPQDTHRELDAIAVVDESGVLVGDVPIGALFLAKDTDTMADLSGRYDPVTVAPDWTVDKVAETLIANRHSSVIVCSEDGHPMGRIQADDVVDALLPDGDRFKFPRVLTG